MTTSYTSILKNLRKEYAHELKKYKSLPKRFNENIFDRLYLISELNEINGYNYIRVEITKTHISFRYSERETDLGYKIYIDYFNQYYQNIYDGSFETIIYLNIADQVLWKDILPMCVVCKPEKEYGFIIPHSWFIMYPDHNRKDWLPINEVSKLIESKDIPIENKKDMFITTGTPNSLFRKTFFSVTSKRSDLKSLLKVVDASKDFLPIYYQHEYKFRLILPGVRSWTVGTLCHMLSNSLVIRFNETSIFNIDSSKPRELFSPYSCTSNVIGFGDRIASKYNVNLEVFNLNIKYDITTYCVNKFNKNEVDKALYNIQNFYEKEYLADPKYYHTMAKNGKKVAQTLLLTDVALQAFDYTAKIYTEYYYHQIMEEMKNKRTYKYFNKCVKIARKTK